MPSKDDPVANIVKFLLWEALIVLGVLGMLGVVIAAVAADMI